MFSGWPGRLPSSTRRLSQSAALSAGAIAIGLVGWSGDPRLLPAAMLFPLLWSFAPTRIGAALVAASYFLAASRGLPQGVSNFFGHGLAAGLALWIAASSLFVAVHAVLWTGRPGSVRVIRYTAAAIMLGIPPVGIVGWAHPITAAGILFPGLGWLGLAAAAALLLAMSGRLWPVATVPLAGLWILSAVSWSPPAVPDGWAGIDTAFGGRNEEYADYRQHRETITRVLATADAVVVLPENALGLWTQTTEELWTRALQDRDVTIFGGAVILAETGYHSVMLELTEQGASVRYRQRMPVPISMWQPWLSLVGAPAGATADFFANPVVKVRGAKVATLICYEQLLIWPILQSAMGTPDILVAPINGWWTTDTEIVAIQIAATAAWARLFDLPLIMPINT